MSDIEEKVIEIITLNPNYVNRYRSGEKKLIGFFIEVFFRNHGHDYDRSELIAEFEARLTPTKEP